MEKIHHGDRMRHGEEEVALKLSEAHTSGQDLLLEEE